MNQRNLLVPGSSSVLGGNTNAIIIMYNSVIYSSRSPLQTLIFAGNFIVYMSVSKITECLGYINVRPTKIEELGDAWIITLPSVQWNSLESGDFFSALKAVKIYINDINDDGDVARLTVGHSIRPRWPNCSVEDLNLHMEEYLKTIPRNDYHREVLDILIDSIQKDIKSRGNNIV